MAEVLNDYAYEIQKITPAQHNLIPLSDCDFTEDAVTKALDKIKIYKTLGTDCIAPRVYYKRQNIISANLLQYYSINL